MKSSTADKLNKQKELIVKLSFIIHASKAMNKKELTALLRLRDESIISNWIRRGEQLCRLEGVVLGKDK